MSVYADHANCAECITKWGIVSKIEDTLRRVLSWREKKAAQRRAENIYFIRAVQRVEALSCVIDGAMKNAVCNLVFMVNWKEPLCQNGATYILPLAASREPIQRRDTFARI
jgi:hypothetical protein